MIIFASGNRGKLTEAREVASEFPDLKILSPLEYLEIQRTAGNPPVIEESGKNYSENAMIKAQAYFTWSQVPCLADDSGLEVDSLGGEPGLHSARYAGEGVDFTKNVEKLLNNLQGVKDRRACFRSVLVCKISQESYLTAQGELLGNIALAPSGKGGFGYDPVFIPDGYSESLAELKGRGDRIATHRVKALRKLFTELL